MIHGNTTHGMTGTTEYNIWNSMRTRCCNLKHPSSKNHGKRGITMCKRWMKFDNFYADMGKRPSKNHTLDRIDNNKGYSKNNCSWVTGEKQHNNRRNNVILKYDGKELTITQWGRLLGIGRGIIWKRLYRGWSVKDALTINSLMPKRKIRDKP